MNINSKVTELRSKVSQMTEVPAHETSRHEAWDTSNNHTQRGLSWQNPAEWEGLHIHANCDTKSRTIQGDNGLEPTGMEQ